MFAKPSETIDERPWKRTQHDYYTGINPFISLWEFSFCLICTLFEGYWTAFPDTKHSYRKKQVGLDFLVIFWEFLSSTSSLDYHLLSSFFPSWGQGLDPLLLEGWSAWSHPRARYELEKHNLLVADSVFPAFWAMEKMSCPVLDINNSFLAPRKTNLLCPGSDTFYLFILKMRWMLLAGDSVVGRRRLH